MEEERRGCELECVTSAAAAAAAAAVAAAVAASSGGSSSSGGSGGSGGGGSGGSGGSRSGGRGGSSDVINRSGLQQLADNNEGTAWTARRRASAPMSLMPWKGGGWVVKGWNQSLED